MNYIPIVAQALGIIILVSGVSILANKKFFAKAVQDIIQSQGLLWLSGFMALCMGAVLVAMSSIWSSGAQLFVAVLGWLAVLKGVLILVFPEPTVALYKKVINDGMIMFCGVIALVLGVVLIFVSGV